MPSKTEMTIVPAVIGLLVAIALGVGIANAFPTLSQIAKVLTFVFVGTTVYTLYRLLTFNKTSATTTVSGATLIGLWLASMALLALTGLGIIF